MNVTAIHPLERDRWPPGMPKAVCPLLGLLMDGLARLGCWVVGLAWFATRVDWVGLLEQAMDTLLLANVHRHHFVMVRCQPPLSLYRGCSGSTQSTKLPPDSKPFLDADSVLIFFEFVKKTKWFVVVS